MIVFHIVPINVFSVDFIVAICVDIRHVTVGESTDISINRSVEVEDIDVSMAIIAVTVDWLAVLIQTVVIKRQIISQGQAFAPTNWIFEKWSFTNALALDGTSALAKFHVPLEVFLTLMRVSMHLLYHVMHVVHVYSSVAFHIAEKSSKLFITE